jgi:4-amino-4-deoxy-L-arabinose transferase-like glycosyltransferase
MGEGSSAAPSHLPAAASETFTGPGGAARAVPAAPVGGAGLLRADSRVGLGWFIALIGWTALISFYHMDGGAYFEPTDAWVAQTAREMQDAGDWFMPRFAGEMRLQKSPGPYWAVMLASLVRGVPVDEVAARIPNAIGGVAIVVAVYWLARRIGGQRAAVYAGFAAASSGFILYWTHRAASDLGLAAWTTLSLACLWVAVEDDRAGRPRHGLLLLGYLAAGMGMLYKLPMPLAIVGLPALAYVLLFRAWGVFRHWKTHLLGLALFLLPWLPWVIAILLIEPHAIAKWRVEFVDRYSGDLPNVEGQDALPYWFFYLLPTAVYVMPYVLSLPGALATPVRKFGEEVHRRGAWFCVLWFATIFLFLTGSVGKESRYLLPALPPLFVLLGIDLADLFSAEGVRRRGTRLAMMAAIPLAPIVTFAMGYATWKYWYKQVGVYEAAPFGLDRPLSVPDMLVPVGIGLAIIAVGVVTGAVLYLRRRGDAAFAAGVVSVWVAWLWIWPNAMPIFAAESPFRDFAKQARAAIPADAIPQMRQIANHDARMIWYSDMRFPRLIDQMQLLKEQDGRRNQSYELRRYGEEMFRSLSGDERVLLVMGYMEYATYVAVVEEAARELGRPIPHPYVWLRSKWGNPYRSMVLVSNKPPPGWEALTVEVPEKLRERLLEDTRAKLGMDLRQVFAALADVAAASEPAEGAKAGESSAEGAAGEAGRVSDGADGAADAAAGESGGAEPSAP